MRSTSELRIPDQEPRWTSGWIVLISVLTPSSAWALHTISPDLVAWYVGAMAWLIFTPHRRPRWMAITAAVENAAGETSNEDYATRDFAAEPRQANSASSEILPQAETGATKARKPRARAKKPKALTLAEVKALTSNADRAVVWSQVGPGKFVRQPGDDQTESGGSDNDTTEYDTPKIIDAQVTRTTVIESENSEEFDDENL